MIYTHVPMWVCLKRVHSLAQAIFLAALPGSAQLRRSAAHRDGEANTAHGRKGWLGDAWWE